MMIHSITGATSVVGVLGYPVVHSLSPLMHNAAFEAMKLDWVYVPFPVAPEAVGNAVHGAIALGIKGMNVTIPHKSAVIPYLDQLTPEAMAIQSVNTIAITEQGVIGHSTDGPGFLRALTERGFDVVGKNVVVLGAGGASRAVVGALAVAGAAKISIVARHPERAEELYALGTQLSSVEASVCVLPWDNQVSRAIQHAELLVNATPIGMAPHDAAHSPVPIEWLHDGLWVYDLVYTPRPTTLLRYAAERGCQTIDGLAMLIYQGAEAFTFWTHLPAPVTIMESALTTYLRKENSE
ncbi:MAG TPA: shikimate dehydrogenase [Armatimonadota bacterium]|nr:shikimate dehydrogenase [Armatimonadota bacterium]